MRESVLAEKRFMSYRGKIIYYNKTVDNELYFALHYKGYNIYFKSYKEAMEYIDKKRGI